MHPSSSPAPILEPRGDLTKVLSIHPYAANAENETAIHVHTLRE
jgi:hypothetical protein